MSNTELPKGTVETVDYINVSLPANTPRGHPHIIEYNIEGETEAPADLNCVDAIATVLRYENPRCLHKLLDVKNVTIVALATGIARKSLCSTHIIRKARDVWVYVNHWVDVTRQFKTLKLVYRISNHGKWSFLSSASDFGPLGAAVNHGNQKARRKEDQRLAMFILSDYGQRKYEIERWEEKITRENILGSDESRPGTPDSFDYTCDFSNEKSIVEGRKWTEEKDVTDILTRLYNMEYPGGVGA